jgi:hypothetical protein
MIARLVVGIVMALAASPAALYFGSRCSAGLTPSQWRSYGLIAKAGRSRYFTSSTSLPLSL